MHCRRRDWLVELAQPLLDRVDAYAVADGSVIAMARFGDLRPFAERPFAHRNIVMPLPDSDAADLRLYLRIDTEGSIALPITVWPRAAFLARDATQLMILGLLFGLLASLVVYNGFLFLAERDVSYLFYVGYLGGATLLQATLHGLGAQFVWPTLGDAGNVAVQALLGLTLWAGAGFSRNFLETAARQPRIDLALRLNGWACLAATLFGFVAYRWGTQLLILCGLVQLPLILWAIGSGLLGGFRPARFIALGFAALTPGGFVYALRTFGVIASTPLTDRAFEIGIALEAVLLSFGLADRINTLTRQKQAAEAAAAAAREGFARRLVERQEQDRRRIAASLHDSAIQTLGAIGSRLRRMAREPGGAALAELGELARETTRELRDIVDDLHPHQLERLGLAAAIRAAAGRAFSGTAVRWSAQILPEIEAHLTPAQAVQIYRIAQEGIANVAKHADATRCKLTLDGATGRLVFAIEDDGRGLGPDAGLGSGLGLSSLAERAALLGAELEIAPRPSGGTRLALTLRLDAATA
jgi:signal transduction histidine kinase